MSKRRVSGIIWGVMVLLLVMGGATYRHFSIKGSVKNKMKEYER